MSYVFECGGKTSLQTQGKKNMSRATKDKTSPAKPLLLKQTIHAAINQKEAETKTQLRDPDPQGQCGETPANAPPPSRRF